MERSKSKKKRSVSNPKSVKPVPRKSAKGQRINSFGIKWPKCNKQNASCKLKLEPQRQKRSNTSNYDFPEFAIYFKEEPKVKAVIDSRVAKHQPPKVVVDGGKSQVLRPIKQQPKKQNRISTKRSQVINNAQHKAPLMKVIEEQNVLELEFKEALGKTFRLLDIFNRGRITEVNINKWVPESALYFLGKPFQQIRSERLVLSEEGFIDLCLPMLRGSNIEDVRQFIRDVKMSSDVKMSINLTQQAQPEQMSPIKKRMLIQQMQRSSQKKSSMIKRNVPLENVIETIKNRQAEICQKIRDVKERKNSISKPLEQIEPNQSRSGYKMPSNLCSSKGEFESRKIKVSDFDQSIPIVQSIRRSQIKQSTTQVRNSSISKQSMQKSRPVEKQNPYVANFTFQLPQVDALEDNKYAKPNFEMKYAHVDNPMPANNAQITGYFKPLSARIMQRAKESVRAQDRSLSFRQNIEQESHRIDRLSSKIQDYMRRNAQKIEKSKSFLAEHSPSRY